MMIRFDKKTEEQLVNVSNQNNVYLEGNILKLIETENADFAAYLETSKKKDEESRKKRLDVTKQFQDQNKELQAKAEENTLLMDELKVALTNAENAKNDALNDLSVMQKKSQFELIGEIVRIALWVIVGVGIVVTGMYLYSMASGSSETTLIGNTWSNLFGILLTNSFSIIGTIMGVKYASESNDKG